MLGRVMKMLLLEMDREAECKYLTDRLEKEMFSWVIEPEIGIWIAINVHTSPETTLTLLRNLIVDMWLAITIKNELINRIQGDYYYQNPTEINQILVIATDLISSNEYESVDFVSDLKETVLHHFQLDCTRAHYNYPERVRSFDANAGWVIDEMIGRAIDEKKQEEVYQTLLQTLREHARKPTYKLDILHVIQGDSFQFYRSDGKRLRAKQLQQAIIAADILPMGFDETELNLTPILALAPRRIYLYGDDPSEKKTVALHNIFEERVSYRKMEEFPF